MGKHSVSVRSGLQTTHSFATSQCGVKGGVMMADQDMYLRSLIFS